MRRVWLTFDDGPGPYTGAVLDTLKAQQVAATFFVIGQKVENGRASVERAKTEGHCIGNHSFSHRLMTTLDRDAIRAEIVMAHELIEPYLNGHRFFRVPFGERKDEVDATIAELGYRDIRWTVDTLDWNPEYWPGLWVDHALEQVCIHRNAVVLAHDIHKTTADNLSQFIEAIRGLGEVSFETCSSLWSPGVLDRGSDHSER